MNNSISLQQAIDMTALFRQEKDNIINPKYIGQDLLAKSQTFDRAIFDSVLRQTGCTGVRVYSGLDPQLHFKAIIVGVNANNEDMLPPLSNTVADGDGTIGEEGILCPPHCPPPSPLDPSNP